MGSEVAGQQRNIQAKLGEGSGTQPLKAARCLDIRSEPQRHCRGPGVRRNDVVAHAREYVTLPTRSHSPCSKIGHEPAMLPRRSNKHVGRPFHTNLSNLRIREAEGDPRGKRQRLGWEIRDPRVLRLLHDLVLSISGWCWRHQYHDPHQHRDDDRLQYHQGDRDVDAGGSGRISGYDRAHTAEQPWMPPVTTDLTDPGLPQEVNPGETEPTATIVPSGPTLRPTVELPQEVNPGLREPTPTAVPQGPTVRPTVEPAADPRD